MALSGIEVQGIDKSLADNGLVIWLKPSVLFSLGSGEVRASFYLEQDLIDALNAGSLDMGAAITQACKRYYDSVLAQPAAPSDPAVVAVPQSELPVISVSDVVQ